MPAWIVGEINITEWDELDQSGHQIFQLPAPVARHFVAPLQQRKGTHIVAMRADSMDAPDLLSYIAALQKGMEE